MWQFSSWTLTKGDKITYRHTLVQNVKFTLHLANKPYINVFKRKIQKKMHSGKIEKVETMSDNREKCDSLKQTETLRHTRTRYTKYFKSMFYFPFLFSLFCWNLRKIRLKANFFFKTTSYVLAERVPTSFTVKSFLFTFSANKK